MSDIELMPKARPKRAIPEGKAHGDERSKRQKQDDDHGDQTDHLANARGGLLETTENRSPLISICRGESSRA